MARVMLRRRTTLTVVVLVAVAATAAIVWRPWENRSSEAPGLPQVSPAHKELIDATVPSPECVSEPRPRPEQATITLDVVRVDGTCLSVDTVWTTEADAAATAAVLRDEPGVLAVTQTPPLTLFDTEEFRPAQWGLDAIGATPAASASPWPTGRGITVAVLDTGIDPTHPDLRGRVTARRYFSDNPAEPGPGYDLSGHGTHVAGIVAANSDGNGIVGVTPQVDLLDVPVRMRDPDTGVLNNEDASSWVAGLVWAVNMGADVVNISAGSTVVDESQCDQMPPPESALESHCYFAAQLAIRAAVAHGTAVVAAVGGTGDDYGDARNALTYPAAFIGVVGVGALQTDAVTPADFSSRNSSVDLMAPGVAIRSTIPSDAFGSGVYESSTGAPYAQLDGTSMAAPFVTGAIASLMQAAPTASVEQITDALLQTATPLGSYDGVGEGRIELPDALKYLGSRGLVRGTDPIPVAYGVDSGDGVNTRIMAYVDGEEIEIGWSGPDAGIKPIEFSPAGDHLLAVAFTLDRRRIVLISLDDGSRIEAATTAGCEPHYFGGQGRLELLIANVCRDHIEHRDPETLELLREVPLAEQPQEEYGPLPLQGAAPSRLLFSEPGSEGEQRLWTVDPLTGQPQTELAGTNWTGVAYVGLSDDGSRVGMISGSTAGACATSYEAVVLDADTLRPAGSRRPPPEQTADRGVYLNQPFFNGDALYAEVLYHDLTDYPNNCADVTPKSGGLWRLDASGWTQVSSYAPEFVAPLGSVGEAQYMRNGALVGYVNDQGVNTCELLALPWGVPVHVVENCSWHDAVIGQVVDEVDLTSLRPDQER